VRVKFNLNGLPDNAVHISGFRGEDARIVEWNVVSLVNTVLNYGRLVRRRYVPPKLRFLKEPHGVTSMNTAFFIVNAVKTSNLT
jgi:hypothetical protein